MATNVGLRVDQMTLVKLLELLHLLVGEDDIASKRLCHEQVLTKCTRTLSQHLIRVGGDDCAKRKNEVMNHLLI